MKPGKDRIGGTILGTENDYATDRRLTFTAWPETASRGSSCNEHSERRLAGARQADQPDLLAAMDGGRRLDEKDLAAVLLADLVERHDDPGGGDRAREALHVRQPDPRIRPATMVPTMIRTNVATIGLRSSAPGPMRTAGMKRRKRFR